MFTGVFRPRLGDRDGKDQEGGHGENNGQAKDFEGVRRVLILREEVAADGEDDCDVRDEPEDGGGEGEVVAGGENRVECFGAAVRGQVFFELDAREARSA